MKSLFVALAGLVSVSALGCEQKSEQPKPAPKEAVPSATAENKAVTVDTSLLAAFTPIASKIDSTTNPITDEKVVLGRMLYFENRLSKNHDLSCNSCHDLAKFGVDGEKTSAGHKKQRGTRNSPTVYNSANHAVMFWDGREKTIEDQALKPIQNPVEMALKDEKAIVDVLKSIPGYEPLYKKAFPTDKDPITAPNTAKAIGAFERTLTTPSKWDKFLAGDQTALSDPEKVGLNKFLSTGCQTCHQGASVGGGQIEKLGKVKPWTKTSDDTGRMMVTKQEIDKLQFKVPSLRNIEKTAPYFHDGSINTLDEAIKLMAEHQIGKQLSDEDAQSIATFLKALTGEIPTDKIAKPELPPSGPKTPKPDAS
jgi:cytochrome c peroxidase